MANFYWAELFSASGHYRLRHNDVIEFSQCIFPMFRQFENFDSRNSYTLESQNNMKTKLRRLFGEVWGITWLYFSKLKILRFTWTGYGDDVIDHDRKLKKVQPNTNLPWITIKKELGRYLLPVLRKKYKTDHHLNFKS